MAHKKTGNYAVPEAIRKMKPKGTMVKSIRGRYYVYRMKNVKESGKWKTKMGKMIGTITESSGFVSNAKTLSKEGMDTLEYGQYALAMKASQAMFNDLTDVFGKDAISIYSSAVIHAVNGYVPTKNVKEYYDQSAVSMAFPTAALSETTLSKLYWLIGKSEGLRNKYFQTALKRTDGMDVAIDGRAIATASGLSDMSSYGYKSRQLKSEMMNLLTMFCVEEKRPLASMLFRGDCPDKVSVMNFLQSHPVKDRLVIIDGGFYSEKLFQLLKSQSCSFLIPAGDNTEIHKNALKPRRGASKSFLYHKGRGKHGANVTVEYREFKEESTGRRYVYFKDISENAALDSQYLADLNAGKEGTSKEGYEKIKRDGGVLVLYTDCARSPEEMFTAYKSRWTIETFYDLLDNRFDMNDLKQEDYYVLQGLSFVISLAMDIMARIDSVCGKANLSRPDAMLEGRRIKVCKCDGQWGLRNMGLKKTADLFTAFSLSLTAPEKWDFTRPLTT